MDSWDPPDAPLPLPEAALYDACSCTPSRPADGAATRETATCLTCLAIRRKRAATTPHTFVWGECLKATPPPPIVVTEPVQTNALDTDDEIMFTINERYGEAPDDDDEVVFTGPIIEELGSDDDEEDAVERWRRLSEDQSLKHRAAAALLPDQPPFRCPSAVKLKHLPHACMAMSDIATWGSQDVSMMTDTDVPSTSDELSQDADMIEWDDDIFDDMLYMQVKQTPVLARSRHRKIPPKRHLLRTA